MKTRLIIVRHGETEYNTQKKYQGQSESPLTERGREQAGCAAERLRNEKIDIIYSSPLSRALDTAKIIRGPKNIEITTDRRLAEIKCGEWEGVVFDELKERYPQEMDTWLNRPTLHRMPGGETLADVKARADELLAEILQKHEGETILIVTHVILVLLLMIRFAGENIEDIWSTPKQLNASINIVEVEGGKATIITRAEQPAPSIVWD